MLHDIPYKYVKASNSNITHVAIGEHQFTEGDSMGVKTLCGRMVWTIPKEEMEYRDLLLSDSLLSGSQLCSKCAKS